MGVPRLVVWGPVWSTFSNHVGMVPMQSPLAVRSNTQDAPATVLRLPRWTMSLVPGTLVMA